MPLKKLTSFQNPFVKHLVKLREERSYREETQSVLVMGGKVVGELCATIAPKHLIFEEGRDVSGLPCVPTTLVTKALFKKITALSSSDGVAAEFALPKPVSLEGKNFILACEGLIDPGNLGTLVRTALALGWEGLFLLPGTVDLFNDKTLRASRGASFLLPFYQGTFEELLDLRSSDTFTFYVADIEGKDIATLEYKERVLLLLGSEGSGPTRSSKGIGEKITIPMIPQSESLNVASAGGILMYALKRRCS